MKVVFEFFLLISSISLILCNTATSFACKPNAPIESDPTEITFKVRGKLLCNGAPYQAEGGKEVSLVGYGDDSTEGFHTDVSTNQDGSFNLDSTLDIHCPENHLDFWITIKNTCNGKTDIEKHFRFLNRYISYGNEEEKVVDLQTIELSTWQPSEEDNIKVIYPRRRGEECKRIEEESKKKPNCKFRQRISISGSLSCNGQNYRAENREQLILYSHVGNVKVVYKKIEIGNNGMFDFIYTNDKKCEDKFPYWYLVVNNTCNADKTPAKETKWDVTQYISFGCDAFKTVQLEGLELSDAIKEPK